MVSMELSWLLVEVAMLRGLSEIVNAQVHFRNFGRDSPMPLGCQMLLQCNFDGPHEEISGQLPPLSYFCQ